MNNIALLISGGVDSSVAALQLVEQGYKPTLFYIVIGPNENFDGYDCSMEEDIEMCKWIANRLNLNLEIVNLHEEYWSKVMEYHLNSLINGFTPNPDVLCNRLIKFGAFNDKFANDFDIYKEYANLVVHNRFDSEIKRSYYCAYVSRRLNKSYLHSLDEVLSTFPTQIIHHEYISGIFSAALGDFGFLVRTPHFEELEVIAHWILEC